MHPEWFSDEYDRLLARAGLPHGVLHEVRSKNRALTCAFVVRPKGFEPLTF